MNLEKLENEGNEHSEQENFPELTPQEKQVIMDKVQDITKEGTAYTLIGPNNTSAVVMTLIERLKNICDKGVLNADWIHYDAYKKGEEVSEFDKEHSIPKKRKGEIYFNIVGASAPINSGRYLDPNKPQAGSYETTNEIRENLDSIISSSSDDIALIFDLSKYDSVREEILPKISEVAAGDPDAPENEFMANPSPTNRSFTYNGPIWEIAKNLKEGVIAKDGLPKPLHDVGYRLAYRIPPRFFKGLVLKSDNYESFLAKIVEITQHHLSKEDLIPIYDQDGNLLWPENKPKTEIKTNEPNNETKE